MRDVTSTGSTPSRRLVTVGALGAAVAVLAGCGIRLEDDAPRVPLVPTRSPIDGEDALLRLLAAVQTAALAPVDPKARISAQLAALHQRQASVLHDALRERGVPQAELPVSTPTPSATTTTPSTSSSPTPSAPAPTATPTAPVTVAVGEGSIVAAGAGVSAAQEELRPTLIALLAQAHAAQEIVAGAPSPALASAPTWSSPQLLAPLITAVQTAIYYLEVAAARSTPPVRRASRPVIASLHTLTAELVAAAGDAAPAPELGRALPRPVTTPAEAAALSTESLSTLLSSFGSALRPLTDADADASFASIPRWLGTVAAQAQRRGIPLTPFPGLT